MARARLRAQSAPPQTQKHTYLLCCGVISIQLFLLPPAYLSFSLFLSLASKLNPLAPFNTKIGATPQLLRLGRERRGGKKNRRIIDGRAVAVSQLHPSYLSVGDGAGCAPQEGEKNGRTSREREVFARAAATYNMEPPPPLLLLLLAL